MLLRLARLALVIVGGCALLIGVARAVGQSLPGQMIAFIAVHSRPNQTSEAAFPSVYVQDITTNRRVALLTDDTLNALLWNADGSALMVLHGQSLSSINVETGETTDITARFGGKGIYWFLSNGSFVLRDGTHFSMVDSSGALVREYELPVPDADFMSWSPDGHYMGYGTADRYTILDTLTGQERYQLRQVLQSPALPIWSSGGHYAAFETVSHTYLLLNLQTGARRALPSLPELSSPDDTRFIFRRDQVLYSLNLTDGSEYPLTDGAGWAAAVAWSPDSKRVVLMRSTNTAIMLSLIDPDGQNSRSFLGGSAGMSQIYGVTFQPRPS